MRKPIARFFRDESGATAVEYGLIVSLVGLALMLALHDLGQTLAGMYDQIGRMLEAVASNIRMGS